jgi:hypothetical protein
VHELFLFSISQKPRVKSKAASAPHCKKRFLTLKIMDVYYNRLGVRDTAEVTNFAIMPAAQFLSLEVPMMP